MEGRTSERMGVCQRQQSHFGIERSRSQRQQPLRILKKLATDVALRDDSEAAAMRLCPAHCSFERGLKLAAIRLKVLGVLHLNQLDDARIINKEVRRIPSTNTTDVENDRDRLGSDDRGRLEKARQNNEVALQRAFVRGGTGRERLKADDV